MRSIVLVVMAIVAVGCGPQANDQLTKDAARPDMIGASSENTLLNAAMEKARSSVGTFANRLQHPKTNEQFSIKVGLATPSGSLEHIWVRELTFANGKFSGHISDKPYNLPNYKQGSPISVGEKDISDWLIFHRDTEKDGSVSEHFEGGFSEDVLLKLDGQPPLPR